MPNAKWDGHEEMEVYAGELRCDGAVGELLPSLPKCRSRCMDNDLSYCFTLLMSNISQYEEETLCCELAVWLRGTSAILLSVLHFKDGNLCLRGILATSFVKLQCTAQQGH